VSQIQTNAETIDITIGDSFYYLLVGPINGSNYVNVYTRNTNNYVTKIQVNPLSSSILTFNDEFFITAALGNEGGGYPTVFRYPNNGDNFWTLSQSGIDCNFGVSIAISPNGRNFVIVCNDDVIIQDYDTYDLNKVLGKFNAQDNYPSGACFSPDQRFFITSNSYSLMIFDSNQFNLLEGVVITTSDITIVQSSLDSTRAYSYINSQQLAWVMMT